MRKRSLKGTLIHQGALWSSLLFALAALTLTSHATAQTPLTQEPTALSALEGMRGRAVVGSSERLGPQAMAKKMHEKRMSFFDKGQAELKKQLNLTPAQEPLWESFIQAVRPTAPEGASMERVQMKEIAQLPSPQRAQKMLELHEARHERRLTQMRSHLEAMKVFYAQLSPEQQKTFDQVTWKHHQAMRRMARGMHRPT